MPTARSGAKRPRRTLSPPLPCVQRPRMLLVEDDADLAAHLERIAHSLVPELSVDRTTSVVEAKALLEVRDYALVVADYLLEGRESGITLRAVCEDCSVTRFALMSAFAVREVLENDGAAACPFLPKPFTTAQCREFLRPLLAAP